MSKEEEDKDIVIAEPVFHEDPVKPWLFRKGVDDGKGKKKTPVPLRLFKKQVQSYWDAKHLFYLHKWLDKTPPELEKAQSSKKLTVAEYIIVKLLIQTATTPHPAFIKMIMQMSTGKDSVETTPTEEFKGTKTVRRILLEMPKSKRVNEKKDGN